MKIGRRGFLTEQIPRIIPRQRRPASPVPMMMTQATAKHEHLKIPVQQLSWMQARLELRQRPILRKPEPQC